MAKLVEGKNGGKVNQYEKGESGNLNGRPPKGFKGFALFCTRQGYAQATDKNVAEVFKLLIQLPVADIMAIAGNPVEEEKRKDNSNQHPALVRLIAKEFLGRRGQEMMKQVLDRAYGMAKQSADITTNGKDIQSPFLALTVERQAEILRELRGTVAEADTDEPDGGAANR